MRSRAKASTACRWPNLLPYAVTRTWHTQFAVLWIATAWLATGLYVAPLLCGPGAEVPAFRRELPVRQPARHRRRRLRRAMGGDQRLLRRWREFLVRPSGLRISRPRPLLADLSVHRPAAVGVPGAARAVAGAARERRNARSSSGRRSRRCRSGCCSAPGFFYGEKTHISIMEYWRWWVVHLWVEGIFEVFATAIVSALVRADGAGARVGGGDRGAAGDDHLPRRRRARHVPPPLFQRHADRGASRSARSSRRSRSCRSLVVGFEAYNRSSSSDSMTGSSVYRWPFAFFVACWCGI